MLCLGSQFNNIFIKLSSLTWETILWNRRTLFQLVDCKDWKFSRHITNFHRSGRIKALRLYVIIILQIITNVSHIICSKSRLQTQLQIHDFVLPSICIIRQTLWSPVPSENGHFPNNISNERAPKRRVHERKLELCSNHLMFQ